MKPLKEAGSCSTDLQAAYDYYKTYNPEAAERFLEAYSAAVKIISQTPEICRVRQHEWRQMVMRRYPGYSIFYKEFPDFWLIGGVLSTLRDPDMILANLLIREISEDENISE